MHIYHLAWRSDWRRMAAGGHYVPASLASEGFVHCTRELSKLGEVAELFFPPRDEDELWLVELDEARIGAPVRDEDPGVGHRFPHVYGPISLAAVVRIQTIGRDDRGWRFPTE